MKEQYQQVLVRISGEMASIIVAVMFALWANNWWAEKQREKEVNILFSAVIVELAENLERLKKSHRHHTEQLTTIVKYKKERKGELTEDGYRELNTKLFSKGIYQPAELFFTYWEILRDKGLIAELSNEQLSALKPVYKVMERYQSTWHSISSNSYNVALLTSEQEKLNITDRTIAEIWWVEKLAVARIEKAITAIK